MSSSASSAQAAAQPTQQELSSGALLLLFTVIIWGVQFPIAKHAFETVNAFHSAVFRFSVPALILLVALVVRESWGALNTRGDTWQVMGLGVLGMCCGPALIFGGLMYTRPEIAAIVVATQPLMTVIVQRLTGRGSPSLVSVLCVVFAFFGVVTVITRWNPIDTLGTTAIMGNLMVLAGALCWVVYTIECGRYRHWSSLRLTTLTLITGAVANTLLVLALVAVGLFAHPSWSDWYLVRWEMLFLAIVGVLGAMFGWNIGAKLIGPLNAMLFINLIPVVTFIVRFGQGYRFEWIEIVGAAMVISALLTQNMYMRLQSREHVAGAGK